MDLNKSFGVDKNTSENGKWFDLEHGGAVLVAKLGNVNFKREVVRLQKPYIAVLRSSVDTTDLMDKLTITAMARTILLGWKNVSIDGEELPYSTEAAEDVLYNYPDFREVVSALSLENTNYMPKEIVEK